MLDQIAESMVQKNTLNMSNELITASVYFIANEIDEYSVIERGMIWGGFDDQNFPKGAEGFLHRMQKITADNILDYLSDFGEYDVKLGIVSDYWSNHHEEILEYCKSIDTSVGEKSAFNSVKKSIGSEDAKHYGDAVINDALHSTLTKPADLTTSIIRQYAVSLVLLAVVADYNG